MYIRTKDRKRLIGKKKEYAVEFIVNTGMSYGVVYKENVKKVNIVLGIYEKVDMAIEALDKIQEFIQLKKKVFVMPIEIK